MDGIQTVPKWFVKLKWAIPGLFFVNFHIFKQILQFLQQIQVEKCPPITWCWGLN